MKFREWMSEVKDVEGLLCDKYTKKVNDAMSKRQLVDIVLDANGIDWLQEMESKGHALPYETILSEFKSYINGRYVAEHGDKYKYTSCMYCCYSDDSRVDITTTLTSFLGCKLDVYIKPYDYVFIFCDKNCELTIHCPETSKCKVEYFAGAKIHISENNDRVKIKQRS